MVKEGNLEKRFQCKICDYKAIYPSYLKEHVKIVHEKIKDHKCGICEYAATTSVSYPLVPVFLDLRLLGKILEIECEANGEAKIEANGEHTTISQGNAKSSNPSMLRRIGVKDSLRGRHGH